MSTLSLGAKVAPARALILAALAAAAGLTLSSLVFDANYSTSCASVASWKFCTFSAALPERAIAVLVLCGLYGVARPDRFVALGASSGVAPALGPLAVGAALVAGPATFEHDQTLLLAIFAWAMGVLLMASGTLRIVGSWTDWSRTARTIGPLFWALAALALALPEIGDTLFPLWHIESVTRVSFAAVQSVSALIGLDLMAYPEDYVLQHGSFGIRVGQSCSGIEGFALITVFLSGYALLFRNQISVARVALILPMALAISWGLNVLRIVVLIWIGVNVSPTLAVDGFHSHAGWLMFTLLALGLIAAIHAVPWFHRATETRTTARALPPLSEDWNAARLLPFAVFMFGALVASTFWQAPALAYPLRALTMGAVLLFFRRQLLGLPWRIDTAAAASGLVVGSLWIATSPAATGADVAIASLAPTAAVIWITTRVIGTTLIVPLIEELFFRSYLLERIAPARSPLTALLAVAISTAAFAMLHDRWLAAALAGLVFAWLVIRREGQLTDAILAHALANGMIAAWALLRSDWSVI